MKKAGNRIQITAEVQSVVRSVDAQLSKAVDKGFITGQQKTLAVNLIGRAVQRRAKNKLGIVRPFKHDTTNKEIAERESGKGKIALSFPFPFVDCYGTFWILCNADQGLHLDCKVDAKYSSFVHRFHFKGNTKSCIKKLCRFLESANNLETALKSLN